MGKKYCSPILYDPITPGDDDPEWTLGASQGTSGFDLYFFNGIDEGTLNLMYAWLDDTDLADMDTNGDFTITLAEYEAWCEIPGNPPWE